MSFTPAFLPLYKTLSLSEEPPGQSVQCHGLLDHVLVPHDDAVPCPQESEGHVPHGDGQDGEKENSHQEPQADIKEAANTDTHLKNKEVCRESK